MGGTKTIFSRWGEYPPSGKTLLVFSTTGGMAPEYTRMNKRLAELIATKKGEAYSHVMQHVRTRLRFALLRCTLVAIRGSRGKVFRPEEKVDISEISFKRVGGGTPPKMTFLLFLMYFWVLCNNPFTEIKKTHFFRFYALFNIQNQRVPPLFWKLKS